MKEELIHILFLPSWYPSQKDIQNGVFIKKQAEAISLNHLVSVISVESNTKNSLKIVKNKNLIEYIGYFQKSSFPPLHAIRFIWRYFNLLMRVNSFDIIHAHVWSKKTFLAYIISILYKKPLIISEHWSGYKDKMKYIELLFCKRVFKKACKILVVSNFLKSLMEKKEIIGNYEIIGNVVEKQKYLSIQSSPFKFLIVSDLRDDIKNISDVIETFKKLNHNTLLSIIGDGIDKQKLSKQKNNRINFKGKLKHSDVLKEIKKHHCLIINSRIETFSIVALESLAAGRPIIYTLCGGPNEIIPENCGISISINNKKELYNGMQSIIENYNDFSAEHLQYSIKEFSPEQIAQKISKVYNKAIKNHLKKK